MSKNKKPYNRVREEVEKLFYREKEKCLAGSGYDFEDYLQNIIEISTIMLISKINTALHCTEENDLVRDDILKKIGKEALLKFVEITLEANLVLWDESNKKERETEMQLIRARLENIAINEIQKRANDYPSDLKMFTHNNCQYIIVTGSFYRKGDEKKENACYLFDKNNEILAGKIIYTEDDQSIFLENIIIYPDYRNKGLGTVFMQNVFSFEKDIFLDILYDLPKNFYKRLGFEFEGPESMIFKASEYNAKKNKNQIEIKSLIQEKEFTIAEEQTLRQSRSM